MTIRELDAAMTATPWFHGTSDYDTGSVFGPDGDALAEVGRNLGLDTDPVADAAGIASLRNALPLLAETLEAAAVVCDPMVQDGGGDRWRAAHDDLRAAIERCREAGLL